MRLKLDLAKSENMPESLPRVVIVGGGFGGLAAAKALKNAPVRIILIDRTRITTCFSLCCGREGLRGSSKRHSPN
jgi:glycine/D-amino acid oxidase-like deaminating enzyme